jgi:phage shock protein PspC (stress-responsive transcriptional regulator)
MQTLIDHIHLFFEKQAFGVCDWWGKKLGISTSRVRLYFIYFSFITLGSPILIYLVMAFFLEHKHYFKRKPRRTVWDL